MRKFAITALDFPGDILFTYNEAGLLVKYENNSGMPPPQFQFLINHFPTTVGMFETNYLPSKKVQAIEIPNVVTFAMFWDKYNSKIKSSRKRSLALWNRLSEADQLRAYLFIDVYNRNRGNAEAKYAETYLSAEQWNNNVNMAEKRPKKALKVA